MREKTPIEKREKEKNLREHGLQVREKNPHKHHKHSIPPTQAPKKNIAK